MCGEVDTEGKLAFCVEASPVIANEAQKANPAHAHIKSAVPRGEGSLRKIRMLLIPHLQSLVALDEYIEKASNDDQKADTAETSVPLSEAADPEKA